LMRWVLPGGLDPSSMLDEVVTRFREELDYANEARNIEGFRDFWRGLEGVCIPEVIRSHSTAHVLTMSWCEGSSLADVVTRPDLERRAWAERLWYFVFRSILVGGAFHADPHPGNYAFSPNGSIIVYDFGCVQPLPGSARAASLSIHHGAVAGDRVQFRQGLRSMIGSKEGAFEDALHNYIELCFRPIFDSPFRITRGWVASLTEAGQSSKKVMLSRGANPTLPPPHLAMMNRLQFGFYSVLARLDVEVDYRAIEQKILREAEGSPRRAIIA
jgi:predicted unusual protein kinase regulating ubiquinone biosynthesis (AarF/ABC1/UbiB family)